MPLTHITVTAPEGRKTPIAPSDGVDPAGILLYVDPGTVCRVRYSQEVRLAIACGDLIPCTLEGKPTATLDEAECAQSLEHVLEGFGGGDRCDLAELAAARTAAAEAKATADAEAKAKADADAQAAAKPLPPPPKDAAPIAAPATRTPSFDTSEKE